MRKIYNKYAGIGFLGLLMPFAATANTLHHNPKLAPQHTGIERSASDHIGFVGNGKTGYFDFPVWATAAGHVTLNVSFASDQGKTVDVHVNRKLAADDVVFSNTYWNKNQDGDEVKIHHVWLNSGLNHIRFTAGENGGPNIYNIAIDNVYPICSDNVALDNNGWGTEHGQSCHSNGATDVYHCTSLGSDVTPIDNDANHSTRALYRNLDRLAQCDKFLFGAEFPLSMARILNTSDGNVWWSDLKGTVNDDAALHGLDPHYMIYKSHEQKWHHLNAAQSAYQRGGVVTYDFHHRGWAPPIDERKIKGNEGKEIVISYTENMTRFGDDGSCIDEKLSSCGHIRNDWFLANIIEDIDAANAKQTPRHGAKANLDATLNEVVNIIKLEGYDFPVALRLYHEMNGNWFWWGHSGGKARKPDGGYYSHEEMWKRLYRYSVDYIKSRTDHVLFVWSPDVAQHHGRDFTQAVDTYWPGDNYVDIVGIDYYEPTVEGLRNQLGQLTDFAKDKGMPAVIAEMGHRGIDSGFKDYRKDAPYFWYHTVLKAIKEDPANKAQRIAWLQTWLHQSWSNIYYPLAEDKNEHPDAYYDFLRFKDDANTVFLWELNPNNTETRLIDIYR